MSRVIEVMYENGVFKPLEKVSLPDKTKLKIAIIENIEEELNKFCGLIGSKITLDDIKKMRYEVKTWKK